MRRPGLKVTRAPPRCGRIEAQEGGDTHLQMRAHLARGSIFLSTISVRHPATSCTNSSCSSNVYNAVRVSCARERERERERRRKKEGESARARVGGYK